MPSTFLLSPEWIAPVAPDPVVLQGHGVLVCDGAIEALAPLDALREQHPDTSLLPLPGHLLTPGFINLHTHAAMSLLRGIGDDLPLERWLRERIWPAEKALVSPTFVHDGALLAGVEMVMGGTTCFNDMYFFPEAALQAALELGMRSVHGIVVVGFPTAYASTASEYLRKGFALRDAMRDEPLASFCIAPHAPYTAGDETLSKVATLAQETGLPVHIHLHETLGEIQESLSTHGVRPFERLMRLGLVGPELIAVHGVHLDEAEILQMARCGATVAHCPHSNLKLGSGIAPISRMRDAGLRVGIGTDGSASNNRLDLLGEARTATLLAKGSSGDAGTWPASEVLRAMTLDAATALGLQDRIGSIEPGKRADLVAIDLSAAELQPVYDPIGQLVYAAGRQHVHHVWVDGKPVVWKRQLAGERAAQAASDALGRTSVWQNRFGEILSG